MRWDIFSNRKKQEKDKLQEEMDGLIADIERFAPRRFKGERESFFYNYRILVPYIYPLLHLLRVISRKAEMKRNETLFTQELFLKLKDFYDVRRRLSLEEALENRGMKQKLEQIFVFFYDRGDMTIGAIERNLQGMPSDS